MCNWQQDGRGQRRQSRDGKTGKLEKKHQNYNTRRVRSVCLVVVAVLKYSFVGVKFNSELKTENISVGVWLTMLHVMRMCTVL